MFRGSIKAVGVVASILVFTFSTFAQHGHGSPGISKSETGVLILAHGGAKNWNEEVVKLAATIDKTMPTETAFGMATKRNIQTAVDKLVARGAKRIVAVPLFISSHSSVITSTEYLLGARAEAPSALAIFAKMDHGSGGSHGESHGAHGEKKPEAADYGTTPVKTTVPILVTSALNGHAIVADILLSRAKALSKDAKKDVVILVAHGPVRDEENNKWLADMKTLVGFMQPKSDFKRIDYLTVRDDAPEPIRSQATADLRAVVQKAKDEDSNVLIVPLLLSYGGIEKGIVKRLEGMDYKMTDQALLPDDRLAEWVMLSVKGAGKK